MEQRQAAAVIPVRAGGDILLMLRDDRPDLRSANRWATIGGHVEPDETPLQAAWREIEEETGRRPAELVSAGFADGISPGPPRVGYRNYLYGAAVSWTLDDVILGEGQAMDWFTPEAALAARLAVSIAPGIAQFLASDVYRNLAALTPSMEGEPSRGEGDNQALSADLPRQLGLLPGSLLAVRGATAGFVARLSAMIDDVRITASPAEHERPNVMLWWPRGEALKPVLATWRSRAPAGGRLWVVRSSDGPAAAELTMNARTLNLRACSMVDFATGESAICLSEEAN